MLPVSCGSRHRLQSLLVRFGSSREKRETGKERDKIFSFLIGGLVLIIARRAM